MNREGKMISPEKQIENVLHSLTVLVNGSAHRYRMNAVRSTVGQLTEMWQKYQAGELESIKPDGLPF